ncbi:MAG: SurA N-terminal domain-containing protein [Alcanivoracaceae bacterium]
MQSFRKFIRGPIGMVLLVLFIVPFIITGFYGYFESGGRGADVVAKVDGTPVYGRVLNERVQQMRQQIIQQSPEVDARLLESFINPAMVLQGLINNELLAVEAGRASLTVSEEQAARLLVELPQFRDPAGRFSAMQLEQFVRARGMTQKSFVRSLRQDLLLNQVRSAFEDTDFALPGEVVEQRRLAEQTRDIVYLRKTVAELGTAYSVSEQEIVDWYEENQGSFMRPEGLRLAYIEVDPASFESSVEITDAQIDAEYAVRRAAMEQVAARAERRRAAHLMVAVNDERTTQQAAQRIASLQDRLAMGEDFAALVREASDDASSAGMGGDLGPVGRGDLPESMEQALFALAEGEVSAPVRTDAGLHLVKLVSVQSREMPTVEESRDDIVRDLRRRLVEERVVDVADRLEDLAFEHSDLQTPSEQLGLPVKTTDWLTLANPVGLLAHAAVREAVSSTGLRAQRLNSDLINLPDGRAVVVRIDEIKPAEPMPLAEVQDRIRSSIQRERALAEIDRLTEAGRGAVAEGAAMETVAGLLGASVRRQENVRRDDAMPSSEVVRAAFRAVRPAEGAEPQAEVLRLANGDLVVLAVTAVRDGGGELSETEQAMALAELAAAEGRRSLRQALTLLRESTKVQVFENRLAGGAAQ